MGWGVRYIWFNRKLKSPPLVISINEQQHSNVPLPFFFSPQPESLCKVTGYTLEDIKPCLIDLHNTYLKAAQHTQQSIREKYKSTK